MNGVPLIAYTIRAALEANSFEEVIVSTDSEEIAEVAVEWGAAVPILRPRELAMDQSTDIEWIEHCLTQMIQTPLPRINFLAILRPTSPLRSGTTIAQAISSLKINVWADSLRAMEITDRHPGKMWHLSSQSQATPYLDQEGESIPTHNRPTQSLEELWVQNASLEIVRCSSLLKTGSISGEKVMGFIMPGYEGFDINNELDWILLEALIARDPIILNALPYNNNQ